MVYHVHFTGRMLLGKYIFITYSYAWNVGFMSDNYWAILCDEETVKNSTCVFGFLTHHLNHRIKTNTVVEESGNQWIYSSHTIPATFQWFVYRQLMNKTSLTSVFLDYSWMNIMIGLKHVIAIHFVKVFNIPVQHTVSGFDCQHYIPIKLIGYSPILLTIYGIFFILFYSKHP